MTSGRAFESEFHEKKCARWILGTRAALEEVWQKGVRSGVAYESLLTTSAICK